jgi:hypothetical protein
MKLNFVLLATSILQTCAQEMGTDCFSRADCKTLRLIKDVILFEKAESCKKMKVVEDATKCLSKALGMDEDQTDLAWKIAPYTQKCTPKPGLEFYNCTDGCTIMKDRINCLENCSLPLKVKSEECLEKLAGKSTENASKNVKCMMECDKDTFPEIFDCQYGCRKDVIDALAAKSSGFSRFQASSIAKVSLSILVAYILI